MWLYISIGFNIVFLYLLYSKGKYELEYKTTVECLEKVRDGYDVLKAELIQKFSRESMEREEEYVQFLLFLKEIGKLSLEQEEKLLELIERRQIH